MANKQYLQKAAEEIQKVLPDGHVFLLLTANIGPDGHLSYVSSMRREDAINVTKEFLLKAGTAENWMKHIK